MKKSFVLFFMVLALIVSSFAFASCTVGGNTGSGSHGGNASSESNFDNESPRESLTESISQSESENVSISADESESENESVIESESTTESERESEEVDPTDTKWFKFTLLDGGSGYSVSKCDDYDESTYPTKIVIPGIYKNMPVISVGAGAFFECGSLTSVTIPSSVISIGDLAFYNCGGLISVSIPSSVISIGDGAFFGCDSLTSVGIPGSVESIGGLPFLNCCSLEQIIVSEANTVYCSVNNCLIEKASRTLVAGCKTSIIPSDGSVTSIGGGAFYNCIGLTSVTIPSSVIEIEKGAFSGCDNLERMAVSPDNGVYCSINNCIIEKFVKTLVAGCKTSIIPSDGSVTSIEEYAFYNCGNLTSVTIPSSVTSIGWNAFSGCDNLDQMVVSPDNEVYCSVNNCIIEKSSKTLVAGCKTSIIPSDGSVTTIGDYAFWGCSNLTSVTIPDSVTRVGNAAFYGCNESLYTKVGGIVYVDNWAVDVVNKTIIFIYVGNKTIISADIKSGTRGIADSAFFDCDSLTSVTIPSSVVSIGDCAFDGCKSLTSVAIPGSVTSIGDCAFDGCKSLTSVVIPESITSIGYGAFSGCENLASINIPNSVTSIGDNAFYGCNEKLYTKADGVVYVDNWAVEVVDDTIISVNITPGTRGIADSAFLFCDSLTSVEIPNSVTSIGDWAFSYCGNLTSVVFNGTMAQWKDVEKGMSWLDGTKVTTIKCSDGEASIYE